MKPSLKYFLIGGIILSLLGCLLKGHPVDLKSVSQLEVIEKRGDGNNEFLIVKGLIFESSLGIDHIKTIQKNDELNILVYVTLASKTRTGNLDYQLNLPNYISTVTFGENRDIIWSRKQGGI